MKLQGSKQYGTEPKPNRTEISDTDPTISNAIVDDNKGGIFKSVMKARLS